MEKELWLTRDNTGSGSYNICTAKDMDIRSSEGVYLKFMACFSAEDFHKYFPGQNIRKGRKKRIKRILIELED